MPQRDPNGRPGQASESPAGLGMYGGGLLREMALVGLLWRYFLEINASSPLGQVSCAG